MAVTGNDVQKLGVLAPDPDDGTAAAAQVATEDTLQSLIDALMTATPPTIDSYNNADINLAANTANQEIIAAPGADKQIWIYGIGGTVDVAGSVSLQDEEDTALTGVIPLAAKGGFCIPPSGSFAMPAFKVATNKAVEIDTVTCTFDGWVQYAIVSV